MDQATTLRRIVHQRQRQERPLQRPGAGRMRVIAVTSGKGGVGKTNTVLNLAMALSQRKRRVFVLDADMGLANVDVLLGLTPRYTLEHVLTGERDISEVILDGPCGVRILPGSSGISELSELSYEQQMRLFREMSRVDEQVDYLFIDTSAGVSSNVLRFNASASEVFIVASPEPTSMTDAYALMKLLAIKYHVRDFGLIANSVLSERDGQAVYDRLHRVSEQFLQIKLTYLGAIPFDNAIRKAVRMQRALLDVLPNSPAARAVQRIADVVDKGPLQGAAPPPAPDSRTSPETSLSFWDRLLHWKRVK